METGRIEGSDEIVHVDIIKRLNYLGQNGKFLFTVSNDNYEKSGLVDFYEEGEVCELEDIFRKFIDSVKATVDANEPMCSVLLECDCGPGFVIVLK